MQVITLVLILLVFLVGFFLGLIIMATLLRYISGHFIKKIKKKSKKHSAKYYKREKRKFEKEEMKRAKKSALNIHSEGLDKEPKKAGNRLSGISKKTSYLDTVSEDEEENSRYINEYRHRQGDAYNFAKKKKLEFLVEAKN